MAAIDAQRALALVGVPFRPQGRDRAGLDCVGLCLVAYRLPVEWARADYRLRGDFRSEIETFIVRHFRKIVLRDATPGDLMLMQVGPDQLHLGIRSQHGFVHADVRLRRVVETPGQPLWPLLGVYRRLRSGKVR